MSPAENPYIHRALDEAFAGITMTPDAQDLKEEIRGNLGARAAELEASGKSPADAAAAAVKELGDIRELVASIGESTLDAAAINRVKPKPAFVVRTVIFSLLLAARRSSSWSSPSFDLVTFTVGLIAAFVAAISRRHDRARQPRPGDEPALPAAEPPVGAVRDCGASS